MKVIVGSSEARLWDGALESLGKGEEEIGVLLVQGGEIGTDGAEGFEAGEGSEAARDFLFDLGHAYCLLGGVVGERDVVIGGESPDIVGVCAQTINEVKRLALSGASALAGGKRARVGGLSPVQNPVVGRAIANPSFRGEGALVAVGFMASGDQHLDQAVGPCLPHLLEDVSQFAQVVRITQRMGARQIPVGFPAIVNQGANELIQDAEGVERLLAPVGVAADPSQESCRQHMQPVERARHLHARFVGMDDRGGLERLAHRHYGRGEKRPGLRVDRQHRRIRQGQTEQVAHQIARAGHRHHVVMGQMHDGSLQARAVLHRSRYGDGKFSTMRLAARTDGFKNLMFGDLMVQGRNVEHLPCLDDDCIRQGAAAGVAALRRYVGFDVIGLGGLLQRVARMPFLTAVGVLSGLALRFRLGTIQPVRGRRLAGVTAVLCQSPIEFGNLGRQRGHLLRQLAHQCPQRPQFTNQIVFLGNAQSFKLGQFIHALSYRLPLPFLKPRVAMLFRTT